MSTLTDIKKIKADIESLRKEAKKKVETIFKTAVLELFVEYPNLKRISWTQYTPYFNDGDTCEFSSGHSSPSIYFTTTVVGEDEEDFDDYEEEWSEYNYKNGYGKDSKLKANLTPEQKAELKTGRAVTEFLSNFDDEDMLNLFGDHQKVSITKKKIEVEDYSHD